jgi:signal transduction histidine kinase
MVNLLLNAAQAIDGPKMANHVRIRLEPAGDRVTIEVEDTGCGIPQDQVEQVFTPFFTTKGETGSGLGLPICKQVVDELEGTITMRSTVGQGSCFTVSLPRCVAAPDPDDTLDRR